MSEVLQFTPEDILIKRDIDYINQILYPEEYKERNFSWENYQEKKRQS